MAALSIGAVNLEPRLHLPPHTEGKVQPKGLDDLTMDAAGNLYVTANGTASELLKVDPATGTACVLAGGLTLPSSVRFATGFGPAYNGKLFVTDFGGAITVVTP